MIKSPFVIQNDQGKYLFYDRNRRLCLSERLERAAKFTSASKAYNVLNCSYPKNKRSGWSIVEIADQRISNAGSVHYDVQDLDIGEQFDWNAVYDATKNSYRAVLEYKQKLVEDLSKVEAELCDCEHACEMLECDFEHGFALYKMIRERRLRRRYIKNELWKANVILNMSPEELLAEDIDSVLKRPETQEYRPRILKELFSQIN